MTSLAEFWTPIYNAFNPMEPVPQGKMASWFVQRPDSPLKAMMARLAPQRLTQRVLLVGHRSSGKSSELARLGSELAARYNYLVIRIDLEQNLEIDRVNPVEVLFLMGAAVYKVAQASLKNKPDQARFDALVDGLNTLVRTQTENRQFSLDVADLLNNLIVFGATALIGPAAAGAASLIKPFSFVSGADYKVVSKLEVEPQIKETLAHLNAIIDDVEAKAGRPLVIIVDGLDKVSLKLAEHLFVTSTRFLAGPGCRVIYTAPIYLYYAPRFSTVRGYFNLVGFPNVNLHTRDRQVDVSSSGYQTMRQAVHKRLQDWANGRTRPSPGRRSTC